MDPELSKAINELIVAVLGGITTIILPMIWLAIRSYAKAKIEAIKDANERDALEFALTRLDATADTVVAEIEQTRRDLVADGKLSRDDAKKLLATAYARIKSRLPQDTVDILKHAYADRLQAVVVGKIESKVAAL